MDVLVIPIFERPEYLRRTLDCLYNATGTVKVYLLDDGSKDPAVRDLCESFCRRYPEAQYYPGRNAGVALNMLRGLELCRHFDHILTIDSDFIMKRNFIEVLTGLLDSNYTPDTIVTGFNATSHPAHAQRDGYMLKKSIGGGNLCFTWETYQKHIRPSLIDSMWDWRMCESIKRWDGRFICASPSVVQHIGTTSTLGHPDADIANDF